MIARRSLLPIGLATAAGLAIGSGLSHGSDSEAPRPKGEVGQYQVGGSDGKSIWLLDSTTGECWRALIHDQHPQWQRFVPPLGANPPQAKPDTL